VKIDRIEVEGFGRLQGFDTGPASLPGLVVVTGPNEAGKSTLFTFLTTALYGFQPASRDRNPHVPWDADEAAGRIRVRLEGGGCADVERRLRSHPSGRLTLDGASSDLRNQPLPWVEHVPRAVFGQVFALTLGDLAGLDAETWARIQEKVVGTMGASDLRSARSVAEALEREAGEVWRPNRRGNQRLRDLQAEGRALRARRGAAHDRDLKIRALVEEEERMRARLHAAREQRQRDRLALERAQSLLPVRQRRDRIAALRGQGGDRRALSALPPDPPARLAELESQLPRLRRRLEALETELAERGADVAAFDQRARNVLEAREDVLRLVARAATCAAERPRAVELEAETRSIEEQLDQAAASVLERAWRDVPSEDIDSVPIEALRDLVARARLAPPPPVRPDGPPPHEGGPTIVALVAGVVLLVWGAVTGSLGATAAGAGLSAVALTLWVAARRPQRARPVGPEASGASPVGEAARVEVRALLTRLPVRAEHLERPGEALVGGLARLQGLLRDRAQRTRALENARTRVAEIDDEAATLARALGGDASPDALASPVGEGQTAEAVAHALDLELRRAEVIQHAADAAVREARRLGAEREALIGSSGAIEAESDVLRSAGEALAPGDPRSGLESARARIAAHRRADELREELERAHPDLAELEAQIEAAAGSPSSWALDDEALAVTRARLEELEEEIERLVKGSEALARDAAHLRERETVDAVDSELASLGEQQARLERDRDRKWVLAKLLREADRRFREEHQPDLLRRASSYLRHLTGGRYERLLVDEREEADLFQVVGPGLPAPVPLAPPVSTGTLEQAYLSLRLAIVDHLDQGGERLPLFIDEVFVNWDRARRSRGLEVLAAVSTARQVFVFTCHEGLAEELEARGARLLPLEHR
jgi:uncharacterized protein YhaN